MARSSAAYTERGNSGREPRWMHTRYRALKRQNKHLDHEEWDEGFRDQTGQNVNYAVNAIAKLLNML